MVKIKKLNHILIVLIIAYPIINITNNLINKDTAPNKEENKINKAYKEYYEFKNTTNTLEPDKQHAKAHLFGEYLYKEYGNEGIIICDSDFNFGCHHGFIIKAIIKNGVGNLEQFGKQCADKLNAHRSVCEHGIGHGLMELMGRSKLTEALSICNLLNETNKLFGCPAGIFMEYNNLRGENLRDFNEKTPYEPCHKNEILEKDKIACYFELSQWWSNFMREQYDKMSKLCINLENNNHTESCLFGLGKMVAINSQYDTNKIITICKQFDTTKAELICRSGAFWMTSTIIEIHKKANEICTYPDNDKTSMCLQKAHQMINIR